MRVQTTQQPFYPITKMMPASFTWLKTKDSLALEMKACEKPKDNMLFFLDADDYLHADTLKVQSLFLDENHTLDAVAIDYYLVDEKENHNEWVSVDEKPIACGIMFRKDLLIEIGLYDESFKAREEEDLRIRFLEKFNIHRIPLPLYRYRRHDHNMTNDVEKMETAQQQLNQKHQK